MKKTKIFLFTIGAVTVAIMLFSSLSFFRFFQHKKTIQIYSRKYQLDPLLVAAIIMVESRFQPLAKSNRGAIGLMQIMPETAKEISKNIKTKLTLKSLANPETNINIGCFYLAQLQKKYQKNLILTLCAYNAGPKRVTEWFPKDGEISISRINNRQTKKYVLRTINTYYKLKVINQWLKIIPMN